MERYDMKTLKKSFCLKMALVMSLIWLVCGSIVVVHAGEAVIWTVDSSGQWLGSTLYNPGGSWKASSYQRLTNGDGLLLWTQPGQASVWYLNSGGAYAGGWNFAPGGSWEATSFHRIPNGDSLMLWTQPGQASVWYLNSGGAYLGGWNFAPGSTWEATSFQRLADGTSLLLWTKTGEGSVWALDSNGAYLGGWNFAPGGNWEAQGIERLTDGTSRLLWVDTSTGYAVTWTLDSNGGVTASQWYGPAAGWEATSFSAPDTMNNPADVFVAEAATEASPSLLIVKKSGDGSGIVLAGDQVCDEFCLEMSIPYIADGQADLGVTPTVDSYFAGWQTEDGMPLENIYYANPGDTVIAVFEKK